MGWNKLSDNDLWAIPGERSYVVSLLFPIVRSIELFYAPDFTFGNAKVFSTGNINVISDNIILHERQAIMMHLSEFLLLKAISNIIN